MKTVKLSLSPQSIRSAGTYAWYTWYGSGTVPSILMKKEQSEIVVISDIPLGVLCAARAQTGTVPTEHKRARKNEHKSV